MHADLTFLADHLRVAVRTGGGRANRDMVSRRAEELQALLHGDADSAAAAP
jgi:hypothetical protein